MTINTFIDALRELIILIPAICLTITIHEYFPGLVAVKLGDPTPYNNGLVKFNPFLFIDNLGFINFVLFRLGWTKHINYDPRNFKRPVLYSIYVIISGMIMNFLTAIIFILVIVLYNIKPEGPFYYLFMTIVQLNLNFFFLNFIPLLPLDAGRILAIIYPKYQRLEIICLIILLLLFIFNMTSFITVIVNKLMSLFIFMRS